jgi:hypothetical protein
MSFLKLPILGDHDFLYFGQPKVLLSRKRREQEDRIEYNPTKNNKNDT